MMAKQAYADWVISLSDHLQTFATFTFPRKISYHWAYCKGVKLCRLTNEKVFGRKFRDKQQVLTTVFTVETKHARPHIHLMQEEHPSLTENAYKELWVKTCGRWVSNNAIKIETIRSKEAVARYINKNVTWEDAPFVSRTKEFTQSEPRGLRG